MQQQPMLNAQINQPMNQTIPNQMMNTMPNQTPKLQHQILSNHQQSGNEQMMDSNSNINAANMNQMTIINQVPNNQIITQNQPINQVPNQHAIQQGQMQMQRVPLQQQNRMVLTGTQIRPGQIIANQNFHVNRMRPQHPNSNIPMQQPQPQPQPQPPQQSSEYFQQPQSNQSNNNPQFQQQTNLPTQTANNMTQPMHNQMPISNTIQMTPSPGSNYVVPSPSNVMGSPMNVNQRISTQSSVLSASPNPTLNTPVMQANSSPQMRQPINDDQMYIDKLRQLSKFIEPLKKMIQKNENSENANSANSNEINKIKNLLNIITNPATRVNYDVLLRCEHILERLDLSKVKTTIINTTIINTTGKDFNVCSSLMETVQNLLKEPNFNHTLQRTINPAVAAITNNSYEYSTKRNNSYESLPEEDIPHTIQGEIARLDNKFYVELDPLQHSQNKTIHLICKIDDIDLPCLPPISIKVPIDYPERSPRCYIDREAYSSSKFFQDIYKVFSRNLEKLPNLYSITTLLDRWELSIREALNCDKIFGF